MVITVTLNPAMDKTLTVDNFSIGRVNRASSIRYDIGGKGINVSKVLVNLGIQSNCTGFLGGVWENIFKSELRARKIGNYFIHIEGNTRTNTKIVDKTSNTCTELNEMGPEISEETLMEFIGHFSELCKKDDIVVLSGGVSQSIPDSIYATLTSIAKKNGAYVILDADGPLLKEALKEKPYIIKPNNHELAALFGIDENDDVQLLEAACKLRNEGISKILVSLGEKGAYYITQKKIYYAKGLRVPVKSTVGAGDSMVAALVYSIINNLSDEDALKFATACGAATVSLEGTTACTIDQVKELLPKVEIVLKEEAN